MATVYRVDFNADVIWKKVEAKTEEFKIPDELYERTNIAVIFGGREGVFGRSVTAALQSWDKSTPFIVLDLGCGPGQNSAILLVLMKEMIREIQENAKIRVYQVDLPRVSAEEVKRNAIKWTDDNCEAIFLPQSFYDSLQMGDDKANLIFSQAALHWVDEPVYLAKQSLSSDETRAYSWRTMNTLLDNMEAALTPGGIIAVACLGCITSENRTCPTFEWLSSSLTQSFETIFTKEDTENMLILPQVPRYLDDIEQDVAARDTLKYIESGELIGSPNIEFTPQIATLIAKAMFKSIPVWSDQYKKLFPERIGEMDDVFERLVKAYADVVVEKGKPSSWDVVYFVLQSNTYKWNCL